MGVKKGGAECGLCGWQIATDDAGAAWSAYHQHLMEHTRRSIETARRTPGLSPEDLDMLKTMKIRWEDSDE